MSAPEADDLWPSLDESIGRQPCFPSGPVWSVLPTLKGQMADMLADVGELTREGVSIDSSKGPVHIHDSATIEPSVHIIGPAYIGPCAVITWCLHPRILLDLRRRISWPCKRSQTQCPSSRC